MKLHLHLLIADTDAGNNVEIFLSEDALQQRQRALMLDLDNNGPASVPALLAEADKKLEAGDVQAAADAFDEAWDLWREDQGFGLDWYSNDDQEIEVPVPNEILSAFAVLIDHAAETYPHFESPRGQADLARARDAFKELIGSLPNPWNRQPGISEPSQNL